MVELTDSQVRSVRTIDDLEAVVEQGLALVVDHAQQFDRSPRVDSTGFQGEGTSGLHETTVTVRIAALLFSPVFTIGIVVFIGREAIGTPVPRVRVAREHEVALRTDNVATGTGIATITHSDTVRPNTTQQVVIFRSVFGVVVVTRTTTIVVIHKTAHTETFVVDDAVAEVHTVDAFVNHLCGVDGHKDRVTSDRIQHLHIGIGILGVVDSIGIHIRALEEVDTNRGRLATVGFRFTTTINGFTIVTVTETTSHVATYIVVVTITEVNVGPRREVSSSQGVGGTVDDFVAIESHVVDFVVGGESESLGTDFKTDGLTT